VKKNLIKNKSANQLVTQATEKEYR